MRPATLAILYFLLAAHATASPPDPDTEVAARRHAAGVSHYRKGEYAAALAEFEAARRARALPAFDFNVARCLDRLERWREAADAYERYAASHPVDESSALDRARALKERVAPTAPTTALAATPLPPLARELPAIRVVSPEAVSPNQRRWRWWTIGSAAVVVGGVVVGLSLGLRNDGVASPATTDGHYVARFP